jgi:hypothetical protein
MNKTFTGPRDGSPNGLPSTSFSRRHVLLGVGAVSPATLWGRPVFARQAVNNWIRTSGAYDAVIDFDAVVRDPDNPTRILPAYDSGDHLHINDAGYQAMAESIDLNLFRSRD